jgi:hypothetical protein
MKCGGLESENHNLRTKFSEAKDLLADSSRCIALKNREIDELKALVNDHCIMIENLKI